MKVGDRHYHTIWLNQDGASVDIIDQRWLPHEFPHRHLEDSVDDVAIAIRDMWVRGAPLIGVTAAYGVAIAMTDDVRVRPSTRPGKRCTRPVPPPSI